MRDHQDDSANTEDNEETPIYEVDADTEDLIQTAVGCINTLASTQFDPEHRKNLQIIADELIYRFGIDSMEVEELQYGDEILYKPRGGVFGDEEDAEASKGEAPSGSA